MSKILRVVSPFFVLDEGDILELSKDGSYYEAIRNEEFHKHGDDNNDICSTYSATFTISIDLAKELIKDHMLEEVFENKEKEPSAFVNIFNEIDKLLIQYTNELNNIDKEFENSPECLKVEKITVLKNLIKTLTYLKSLKK